jgi:hypothetical protein
MFLLLDKKIESTRVSLWIRQFGTDPDPLIRTSV